MNLQILNQNKTKTQSINKRKTQELKEEREIFLNADESKNKGFPSNYVKTTKYTILTFLPLSLFIQFTRIANIC
jgi:phospholipid-transporting ATPase